MNLKIYQKTRYQNIYKHVKNKTYAVDISLGYNSLGKRVRTTRTGIADIDTAKEILADSKIKDNIKIKVTNKTIFKDIWPRYTNECVDVMKLSYNTMKKKNYAYKFFISPFFDNFNINDINKNHIINFHAFLKEKNIEDRTRHDIIKILSAFFNWCVKEEIVTKNYVPLVPNFSYKEKEKNIWNAEQFEKYIKVIEQDFDNNPHKAIFTATISKLFFLGGFRLEELLSLKKGMIKKNGVYIEDAVIYQNHVGYVKKDTKTKSSERIVNFGEKMIKTLNDYIHFIDKYCGITLNDDDYIFINVKTMKLYSDNTIRKYINYYGNLAGNPHITPHALRHSHATLLHDLGWDMFDISKRLGHSSTNVTEKIYCHLSNNRRSEIAKNMDDFL